jgi:hypothetical protein
VIVAWRQTLDLRLWCAAPEVNPYDVRHGGQVIYASWHESILAFTFIGMPLLHKTQVLISQSRDGEYITQVVQRLGARVARGSSSRRSRAGLLEMAHVEGDMNLAITPDGPRGPRRQVQRGSVFLASRTGLPVVPLGFGFSNAWRAHGWDRFAVPLPFSQVTCVAAAPIRVPATLNDRALEYWRTCVEREMLAATERAEEWAAGGAKPRRVSRASRAA